MQNEAAATGAKYHRYIYGVDDSHVGLTIDVYCVLDCYRVTCPATGHAIKKLLCAGLRGKGDRLQDLIEARDAITRAIALHKLNSEVDP